MFSERSAILVIFSSLSLLVFNLYTQDIAKDQERYKPYKPRQILEVVERLKDKPSEVVFQLNQKLNEFYLSDISKKKIQARKKTNYGLYNIEAEQIEELSTNIRRLLMKDITGQQIKGVFIKSAKAIFLMHKFMAQNLLQLPEEKLDQAAFHYRQSLKYRRLRLDPDIFTSPERLELLDENDPQIELADQYRNTEESRSRLGKEIREFEEQNVVLQDSLYNSKEKAAIRNKISENQRKIDSMQENLLRLDAEFKELKDRYKDEEEKWNEESADLLQEFAQLIKRIERNLKKRQRVSDQKLVYKTSFDQAVDHDHTRERNFNAYSSVLEAASNLDPKNAKLSFELGNEYNISQKIQKAILFFHKALNADPTAKEEEKLSQDEIKKVYISLGGLYYQHKRFVDSAQYYEKALVIDRDTGLLYPLGKLHYQKTGSYQRVIELLSEYLKNIKDIDPQDPIEKAHLERNKFLTLSYIAGSFKKLKEYSSMFDSMERSRQIFNNINQIIYSQNQKLENSFKQLQGIKKPILDQTTQAELNRYYSAESQYKKNKIILSKMYTVRNTLPLESLYFNLADHLEKQKNITRAIDIYREAEKNGISPDAARRNITRLKAILGR